MKRETGKKRRRDTNRMVEEEFLNIEEINKKRLEDMAENAIKNFIIDKNFKYKTAKQKTLVKAIHDNEIVIVHGSAGTGKAQPVDEPILTPNGFVRMGDIKVGDLVVSVDGNPTKVLGVFPQGDKEIYRIEFSDGTFTECCEEHLWITQTEQDRFAKTKIKGKSYSSPRKGQVRSTKQIMETLLGHDGRMNHSIPLCSPVEFKEKHLKVDPYMMGILLGDGGIKYDTIVLSTSDNEILEYFQTHLDSTLKIEHRSKYDFSIAARPEIKTVGRNSMKNALVDYSLHGCGSKDKFIPEDYLFNSVKNRIEILRGLMDSDGHASNKGASAEFYSISKNLIDGVSFLVRSLGGTVKVRSKIPTYHDKDGNKRNGQLAYTLTLSLNGINPFKLKRKAKFYNTDRKYYRKFIKNITPIGVKQAQCIKVEHESALYLTRDFIVTHNTYCALKAALEVLKLEGNSINRLLLTKPIVEAGESIGFLPGGIEEKTDPYMGSFVSNVELLIGKPATKSLISQGIIKWNPLPYLRGDTFRNSVAILDEAQNTTITAMKLFISRKSEESKLIILGDVDQSDLDLRGKDNGLLDAYKRLSGIDKIALVEFTEDEIVRSGILKEIMKKYKS